MTFPIASLASAKVVSQVDRKFVLCVLEAGDRALVVFDQHAADERVAVETILDGLCEGFASDTMPTTELDDVRLVLTRAEGEILALPGVRDVLCRWGIALSQPEEGDYIQVSVLTIPSALERLGRKKGEEMTRLLKVYLPLLAENLGEIQAFLASEQGLARVLRWMPAEMLELANSKACRGMFT